MDRRRLLKTLGAAIPAFAMADPLRAMAMVPRLKITDIKVFPLRVVKDLGTFASEFHYPPNPSRIMVGGGSITEIYTDQGVVGYGGGISPAELAIAKARFVGKDVFDIGIHARQLQILGRWGHNLEIAMWDTIGKACNVPLVKLWGGGLERVMPYAATLGLGSGPETRAAVAVQIKEAGFKGVKMRSSYPTLNEDIRMMEQVRKAVGDDFILLTDGNKAGPYNNVTQLKELWDFQRAVNTALAYQELGLYWLEEPLGKFDYSGLGRLRDKLTDLRLAGGETINTLAEFQAYLDHDSYDILNTDCSVCGVTMWRQVSAMALAKNRHIVPHASGLYGVVTHMHLAASQAQVSYGDMDYAPHFELQHNPPYQNFHEQWSIFTDPPKLDKDGYLPVPTAPGLGLTIKPDLILRT